MVLSSSPSIMALPIPPTITLPDENRPACIQTQAEAIWKVLDMSPPIVTSPKVLISSVEIHQNCLSSIGRQNWGEESY